MAPRAARWRAAAAVWSRVLLLLSSCCGGVSSGGVKRHPVRSHTAFALACSPTEFRVVIDGLVVGAEYRLEVVLAPIAGSAAVLNESATVAAIPGSSGVAVGWPLPTDAAGVLQSRLTLYDTFPGLDDKQAFVSALTDDRACLLPLQQPAFASDRAQDIDEADAVAGSPQPPAQGVPLAEFKEHRWVMMVSSVHKFPVTCCLFGQQLLNYLETAWLAGCVLDRGLIEPTFIHQARDDAVYEQKKAAGELTDMKFHAILGTIPIAGAALLDAGEQRVCACPR